MAWDDLKTDGSTTLPAAEYNTMVSAIKNQGVGYYIFISGGTYYAKNMGTGAIEFSGTDIGAVCNSCIGANTYGASIQLGPGSFNISTPITSGAKVLVLKGTSGGMPYVPTTTPFTKIVATASLTDYFIKLGAAAPLDTSVGSQIENLYLDGFDRTTPLGGIYIQNVLHALVRNVFIDDIFNAAGIGINVTGVHNNGDATFYARIENLYVRRLQTGLRLGEQANAATIIGGQFAGRAAGAYSTSYGALIDGTDTATFLGSTDFEDYDDANYIGVYIKSSIYDEGSHRFFGTRFEGNINDVRIDLTAGYNNFFGCGCVTVLDNCTGNAKSRFSNCNYKTENWGTATINAGTTKVVSHGLSTTPTIVNVTPTSDIGSGIRYWVDTITATQFTINASGTVTKTFYWNAKL